MTKNEKTIYDWQASIGTGKESLETRIKEWQDIGKSPDGQTCVGQLVDDLIASRERLKKENEKMAQVFKDELCSMAIKLLAVKEWALSVVQSDASGNFHYEVGAANIVLEIINAEAK